MHAAVAARAAPSPIEPGGRLGPFELRRPTPARDGPTRWWAWDPRDAREVLLTVLYAVDASEPDTARRVQRATQARALEHACLLAPADAGAWEGCFVAAHATADWPTLAQRLRDGGPVEPEAAARSLRALLDGLDQAHRAGLTHGAISPDRLLWREGGLPLLIDFGLGELQATPADDLAAVAALLAAMLGTPPPTPDAPPQGGPPAHDALRTLAWRAVCADPSHRWPDAAAMRDGFAAWLDALPPEASPADAPDPASRSAALDFLLRRMRFKSDFPALSEAVAGIQRVASSPSASLSALCDEVMKDVALTNKLLRLVNTAQYQHAGGGSINTVSRAASLIGFAGVRNLAMSLVLVEHLQDKALAARLCDEFLRALMAGTLASGLSAGRRAGEEAFLVGLMQNLGRLLATYYFPEEAMLVSRQCSAGGEAAGAAQEETASLQVLGTSYSELGRGVARAWGLPVALQAAMASPEAALPRQLPAGADPLRWQGLAANELARTLLNSRPAEQERRLREVAERFEPLLGVPVRDILEATGAARQRLAELSAGLGLVPSPESPAQRLLPRPDPAAATRPAADPLATPDPAPEPTPEDTRRMTLLTQGIQAATQALMDEGFALNDLLQRMLLTMQQALGAQRAVLCLRDRRSPVLQGRFGLGAAAEAACRAMRIDLSAATPDLLAAVCLKGADLLVEDASAPGIANRLPAWWRPALDASSFLLLPMRVKGTPIGLIYLDHPQRGGIRLAERELSLLRSLRNQAVMAFRAAGQA